VDRLLELVGGGGLRSNSFGRGRSQSPAGGDGEEQPKVGDVQMFIIVDEGRTPSLDVLVVSLFVSQFLVFFQYFGNFLRFLEHFFKLFIRFVLIFGIFNVFL
jgi:hypothetical protein